MGKPFFFSFPLFEKPESAHQFCFVQFKMLEELEKVFNEIKRGEREIEAERASTIEKRKFIISLKAEITKRESENDELDKKISSLETQVREKSIEANICEMKLDSERAVLEEIEKAREKEKLEYEAKRDEIIKMCTNFGMTVFGRDLEEMNALKDNISKLEDELDLLSKKESFEPEKQKLEKVKDEAANEELENSKILDEILLMQERANYLTKKLKNEKWKKFCQ